MTSLTQAETLLRPLDLVRAQLLGWTLRIDAFHRVFRSRVWRHALLVTAGFITNAVAMFYFPLWTLLLVPSFLGALHLVESLSTFHETAAPQVLQNNNSIERKTSVALVIFCLCFAAPRIAGMTCFAFGFHSTGNAIQTYLRLIEFSIFFASFFYFLKLYGLSWHQRWIGLCGMVTAAILIALFPNMAWGIFILSHNAMAFGYWYVYAPTRQEKVASILFGLLFILVHLWLLSSLSDRLMAIPIDQTATEAYGYTFLDISTDLFPGLWDLQLGRKITMLLMFGQGIHYLLWIKVIPECRLKQAKPTSFRIGYRIWKKQWGSSGAIGFLLIIVGFSVSGLIFKWHTINMVFFAIAFYHIYAEFLAFALCERLTKLSIDI